MAAENSTIRKGSAESEALFRGKVLFDLPGETAKQEPPPKSSEAQPRGEVVHLPVWPNLVRPIPNGLLRSALFGVVERGARRYLRAEPVVALDGIEIFYTGEQLDQGDLDVWIAVIQLCRAQAMGERCFFSAYELLKTLGKDDTGGKHGSRKVLDIRLTRMKATAIRIRVVGRYSYEGSLLDEIYRDEETGRYVAVLNPKMRALFGQNEYTQLEWSVRQALEGKPLAQWLHAFFSSHAAPLPISMGKLRGLCGSEISRERAFKEKLRKALDAVAEASAAHGQPFSFSFEGELVCVQRTPSAAQKRHLMKNKAPRR